MTPVRSLSKTQLQLIERLRMSPVLSSDLIPEYAGSKGSLKSQISMIRRYGGLIICTRKTGPAGRGNRDPREYFIEE